MLENYVIPVPTYCVVVCLTFDHCSWKTGILVSPALGNVQTKYGFSTPFHFWVKARPHCLHVDILHVEFYMSPQCGLWTERSTVTCIQKLNMYRRHVTCIRSRKSTSFYTYPEVAHVQLLDTSRKFRMLPSTHRKFQMLLSKCRKFYT